jgi:hypothetical protein
MPGAPCCARNCCLGTTSTAISHTDILLTVQIPDSHTNENLDPGVLAYNNVQSSR